MDEEDIFESKPSLPSFQVLSLCGCVSGVSLNSSSEGLVCASR